MNAQPRQRRIDRVTDPAYLDGVTERPAADLRSMRDECLKEEARLSYARRVLHGQIDIARAEAARRGHDPSGDLLASLADILADPPAGEPRDARAVGLYDPEVEAGRRRDDAVLDEPAISRMPELPDDELRALAERLADQEREVSAQRRTVLDHVDQLQSELVRRYREGRADVDEVVSNADHDAP